MIQQCTAVAGVHEDTIRILREIEVLADIGIFGQFLGDDDRLVVGVAIGKGYLLGRESEQIHALLSLQLRHQFEVQLFQPC